MDPSSLCGFNDSIQADIGGRSFFSKISIKSCFKRHQRRQRQSLNPSMLVIPSLANNESIKINIIQCSKDHIQVLKIFIFLNLFCRQSCYVVLRCYTTV